MKKVRTKLALITIILSAGIILFPVKTDEFKLFPEILFALWFSFLWLTIFSTNIKEEFEYLSYEYSKKVKNDGTKTNMGIARKLIFSSFLLMAISFNSFLYIENWLLKSIVCFNFIVMSFVCSLMVICVFPEIKIGEWCKWRNGEYVSIFRRSILVLFCLPFFLWTSTLFIEKDYPFFYIRIIIFLAIAIISFFLLNEKYSDFLWCLKKWKEADLKKSNEKILT